ncbi:hypothetical protein L1987_14599 [Smallanthus sonchifolius]|uniref:Uncharacterized protein n=1 Tax=Smallanthus sonchifolius TaxID=185202 RepID=A0ACB9J3T3_9ASTR|nr:hypothetical protein L1987_14599 [Smallanthus sonchifolius]
MFGLMKLFANIKLNISQTLMRIEIVKKRRTSLQKYLRSVIAELQRLGHHSDAYERVGRLYLDENRSLCYDFVEGFCTLISDDQLKAMTDQRECPEECKEAVSSLMYAAARFGDLPELQELRSMFSKRYGSSLESFVNKEFIDLMTMDPPTKNMKIRSMQEIAQEHGVEWSENAGDNQEKEPCITDHKNDWVINIPETVNYDDINDRTKDESNDDIVKQTENSDTTCEIPNDHPNIEEWDVEKVVAVPRAKSRRWRNVGALPRVKIHPVECWPEPAWVEEQKGNEMAAPGHVHPKLPDYDDIIAQFASLRAKS